MAAPLASPLFRRLAGRGALFCGFPFRWVLHFVLSLTRCVALHDSASCSRKTHRDECGRPCDTLSCLLFSALWLRCNQSILVQEIQSVKDTDMICSKMLPIKATTCLQGGPMSLDWPIDLLPDPIFPDLRCLLKFPAANNKVLFQLPLVPVGDRMSFTHNRIDYNVLKGWNECGPFLSRRHAMYYLEHQGSCLICFLQKGTESSNSNISRDSLTPTTLCVSRT